MGGGGAEQIIIKAIQSRDNHSQVQLINMREGRFLSTTTSSSREELLVNYYRVAGCSFCDQKHHRIRAVEEVDRVINGGDRS